MTSNGIEPSLRPILWLTLSLPEFYPPFWVVHRAVQNYSSGPWDWVVFFHDTVTSQGLMESEVGQCDDTTA